MKKLLMVSILAGMYGSSYAERPKVSLWNRIFRNVNEDFRRALLFKDKGAAIKALNEGADPNYYYRDSIVEYPMIDMALQKGWDDVVDLMIKNGLDLRNTPLPKAMPLLMRAIENNLSQETLQKMVQAGANPNQTDRMGRVAVSFAQNKNQLEALYALGAKLDVMLPGDFTLLQYYIIARSPEMVAFLLEHGANPNDGGVRDSKPLYLLAAKNDDAVPLAQLLIKYGADIHAKNKLGATALMMAQALGNEPLYNYLLSISQ